MLCSATRGNLDPRRAAARREPLRIQPTVYWALHAIVYTSAQTGSVGQGLEDTNTAALLSRQAGPGTSPWGASTRRIRPPRYRLFIKKCHLCSVAALQPGSHAMLKVYACIFTEHDLKLVALAVVICGLSSFTAISLLNQVRRTTGRLRHAWIGVAAATAGSGVWATHFIAMLGYFPVLPSGYEVVWATASLAAAIVFIGIGLATALRSSERLAPWLGGAIAGVGIAVMHYLGMAAFETAAQLEWNLRLVAVSVALGPTIASFALPIGLRDRSAKSTLIGASLLTTAICSLHFTAMAAATLTLDPAAAISDTAIPRSWLAVLVSFVTIAILLLAFFGYTLDRRERRNVEREANRMRGLANASLDSLLICDGTVIITVNASFVTLIGRAPKRLTGSDLASIFPNQAALLQLEQHPKQAFETVLQPTEGVAIPVEVMCRPIVYSNRKHHAIAIRDLRQQKRAAREIKHLSRYDSLTGLANRNVFNRKLDELMVTHRKEGPKGALLAVLCIDLDRFKEVNNVFGHAAGDKLLQTIGKSISKLLKEDQIVARVGEDEFAIIAPGLSDPMQAGLIAENVLETVRNKSENLSNVGLSTSVGVAIFPIDAAGRTSLMSHADTALSYAKAEGGGTYRFFDSTMGAQIRERRRVESQLRQAISNEGLSILFQPWARIDTQEVVGFEAILHWIKSERTTIPAKLYISIAEECGLILEIGERVLREACREAARWVNPLLISVNVSTNQLYNARFVQLVHEVLLQSRLSPNRLELWVTETALIRDINRALSILRQLKELGVRIAMDDFGSGYSSLQNLRAFPFDKIKINASFIRAVNEGTHGPIFIRALIGLSRDLKVPVLADGVETLAELAFLKAESCPEVQGHLIGKPQSIDAFWRQTGCDPEMKVEEIKQKLRVI
jgi:diguanylate cyclase